MWAWDASFGDLVNAVHISAEYSGMQKGLSKIRFSLKTVPLLPMEQNEHFRFGAQYYIQSVEYIKHTNTYPT